MPDHIATCTDAAAGSASPPFSRKRNRDDGDQNGPSLPDHIVFSRKRNRDDDDQDGPSLPDHIATCTDTAAGSASLPFSRKRNRDDGDQNGPSLPDHIRISSVGSVGAFRQPEETTLEPIALVDRSSLPLYYLDHPAAGQQYFHGTVECLDLELPNRERKVLVATDCNIAEPNLCVLERGPANLYVLSLLRPGTELRHLQRRRYSSRPVATSDCTLDQSIGPWWRSAALQAHPVIGPSRGDRGGLKLSVLIKPSEMEVSAGDVSIHDQKTGGEASMPDVNTAHVVNLDGSAKSDASGTGIFVAQYLETLYISRTSLAYVAKSSLPRLRASMQPPDLADFLRGLILSSKTADTKHKDVLLKAAQTASTTRISDVETPGPGKTRRKDRKLKTDKQGLLGSELEYFTQWWHADTSAETLVSQETVAQQMKRRSLGLRTRETFLQIMLIMEVMACEADVERAEAGDKTEHGAQSKTRNRKKQDVNLLLELLLDKLAIWHSLDQPTSHAGQPRNKMQVEKSSDVLRDFCVEVIIPFYSARLPEASQVINKKLGGPMPDQERPRSGKPRSRRSEGGTGPEKRSRGPLQRISSEQVRQPSAVTPGLHRSATDSQLGTHRERAASETRSLSSMVQPSGRMAEKKPSAMDKIRLRQREVDFDAMSQAQEAKRKKQAEIDARLKEAINALKKPQRTLVSAELADAVAQRKLMARARARPAASRKKSGTATQVEATPKHGRSTFVQMTPHQKGPGDAAPASSSTVAVPSSAMRPFFESGDGATAGKVGQSLSGHDTIHVMVEDSPSRPLHYQDFGAAGGLSIDTVISATPCRGAEKFKIPALPTGAGIGIGGVRSLRFTTLEPSLSVSVPRTPTKSDRRQSRDPVRGEPGAESTDGGPEVVDATSEIRKRGDEVDDTPMRTAADAGTDIYDALGWND